MTHMSKMREIVGSTLLSRSTVSVVLRCKDAMVDLVVTHGHIMRLADFLDFYSAHVTYGDGISGIVTINDDLGFPKQNMEDFSDHLKDFEYLSMMLSHLSDPITIDWPNPLEA